MTEVNWRLRGEGAGVGGLVSLQAEEPDVGETSRIPELPSSSYLASQGWARDPGLGGLWVMAGRVRVLRLTDLELAPIAPQESVV